MINKPLPLNSDYYRGPFFKALKRGASFNHGSTLPLGFRLKIGATTAVIHTMLAVEEAEVGRTAKVDYLGFRVSGLRFKTSDAAAAAGGVAAQPAVVN